MGLDPSGYGLPFKGARAQIRPGPNAPEPILTWGATVGVGDGTAAGGVSEGGGGPRENELVRGHDVGKARGLDEHIDAREGLHLRWHGLHHSTHTADAVEKPLVTLAVGLWTRQHDLAPEETLAGFT